VKRSWFAGPYALWMLLFTVAPLLFVVFYAFTNAQGGVTLANMIKAFDGQYLTILWRSLYLAALCTVLCFIVGYPAAYFLASKDFSRSQTLLVLILLPMWMNFLLRTYSWLSLLENSGLVNRILGYFGVERIQFLYNEGSVVFGTVYNFLPFMIIPIQNVLMKMDDSLLEAAYDLGATPVQRFLRIVVPFSVPGVISGITMTFVPSVTTFVVSQLMGGGKVPLVGDIIERQFRVVSDWHFGSAVSVIVMIVIISMMVLMNKVDKSDVDERGVIL